MQRDKPPPLLRAPGDGGTVDAQHLIDEAFDQLRLGTLGRAAYVERVDAALLVHPLPQPLAGRLRGRCDERTPGRFALAIHDNTRRERLLVEAWLASLGRPELYLADAGIGNDGRLLLDPPRTTHAPDYVVLGGRRPSLLEVKFGPTARFATFRTWDLERCSEQGTSILVVLGARMLGPSGDPAAAPDYALPPSLRAGLMTPAVIARVLEQGEGGSHPGFGGKPTIRIYPPFPFKLRPLCPPPTRSPRPSPTSPGPSARTS